MANFEPELFYDQERSNWVRLRTLVMLRWFAIAGQVGAILVATLIYRLEIEAGLASIAVGASVILNLVFGSVYPMNKRLSEREAALMLVFDILQLAVLLFLTGGLNNPFAVLILAPVTIAATVLHLRSTIILGVIAIGSILLLRHVHLPITTQDGTVLTLPPLFLFGFWVALSIGVMFLGIYARQVTTEAHIMGEALLATQLALSRAQKLTDLGGVIAATAHELGTPLATIKLASSEMMEDAKDNPDLLADAALIGTQADRCRDILQSMGRAGKDDLHLHYAPLETVVREAAEPHTHRGKTVDVSVGAPGSVATTQPIIARRPEIIHGLRNLIQNAVDFAQTQVAIAVQWTDTTVTIRISDDGPGFPQSVLGRIGDPFVRRKRLAEDRTNRPGYEGMGLGLFIAKTMLERSGARLTFANGRHRGLSGLPETGAIITIIWARSRIEGDSAKTSGPLGENQRIT